ncbi:MFS transporter [Flavipsychrobacter stenotrophus]|uniref:MFS transporter n=1 Tax=Flavipsychrobacter stenotrophus TaxID=2077091 RepID=A0A2S7SU62_9BACT|nr:MFS transporter [Flavipsychrobacter stenotrophus]PQJ10462.1 MFS transporter [Flavipsychrobacter stenotrophus]
MKQNELTLQSNIWKVISASSVGTLIEWYDFYIFGSLSTIIASKFFPSANPTAALLSTLATFAAGFIVRPFGALVFGRLGDLIGRKYTFLLTLVLMGGSTFLIGCVPSYATIGAWAPFIVLMLRLLQGLALGGEYGGAATYVAEHAPQNRRGFYTSWIQTTATLGLFLSLIVILTIRRVVGVEEFTKGDGWRYPFLLSIVLVGVSIVIRMKMHESPLFSKLKAEGKVSKNPLKESFGNKTNFKMVLLALFGVTMGQGVVWYTGQFYAQSFILTKCNVEYEQANTIILISLMMATPFFVIFGSLSDKIGRKYIMMTGMLLGVLCYRPLFDKIYQTCAPANKTELVEQRITNEKHTLVTGSTTDSLATYDTLKTYVDGSRFKVTKKVTKLAVAGAVAPPAEVKKEMTLNSSGYWTLIWLVGIMVLFVTMVYGPVAAFLVELFPTKIRYTSMSLPYHIGNGIFGGLVPFVATLITTIKGTDHLSGLWYPIGVAALSLVIGTLYVTNKKVKEEN